MVAFRGARDGAGASGQDVLLTVAGDDGDDVDLAVRAQDGEMVVLDATAGWCGGLAARLRRCRLLQQHNAQAFCGD